MPPRLVRARRSADRRGTSSVARLWLLACGASAMIAAATVGLLLQQRAKDEDPSAHAPPAREQTETSACAPAVLALDAPSNEQSPPVVLWAVAPARLYLDGVAAFSSPEAAKRFTIGEHVLRIEAEGQEPFETRLRLEPYTPALLHAQVDPRAGISVVRFGAPCAGCPAALSEELLDFAKSPASARPRFLLEQAAHALRANRRTEAAEALRQIAPKDRRDPLFARLAAQIFHDTFQVPRARETLTSPGPGESTELSKLLSRLDALARAEEQRKAQALLFRWNRLTDNFNQLIERYGPPFPGPTDVASRRLGALSVTFEEASQQGNTPAQLQALTAAESALGHLVEQLKSLRPGDCAFHTEVVAAASR